MSKLAITPFITPFFTFTRSGQHMLNLLMFLNSYGIEKICSKDIIGFPIPPLVLFFF